MQDNQPEALRLADVLDQIGGQFPLELKISKELRRLHEVNMELDRFVEDFIEAWEEGMGIDSYFLRKAYELRTKANK